MRRMMLLSACLLVLATMRSAVSGEATPAWADFWKSVKVEPPPPTDFLDGPGDRTAMGATRPS